MSNREALRKLSRKFPTTPEIEKILDGLSNDADISVAIVGASLVEFAVERILKAKFRYRSAKLEGQLFLNRGPLSDFHSKILVAHAFGYLTTNMAEELHSIKAIRNAFAHAKIPINFDNPVVEKEIKSLKTLNAIKSVESEVRSKLDLPNKSWYLLIVKMMLIFMDPIEKKPGGAHELISEELGPDWDKSDSSS